MLGEVIRVLAVAGPQGREQYEKSLFSQADAQRGSCMAAGTIYTAGIAAGLMVHQLVTSLRGMKVATDLMLNLLAEEITTREA